MMLADPQRQRLLYQIDSQKYNLTAPCEVSDNDLVASILSHSST